MDHILDHHGGSNTMGSPSLKWWLAQQETTGLPVQDAYKKHTHTHKKYIETMYSIQYQTPFYHFLFIWIYDLLLQIKLASQQKYPKIDDWTTLPYDQTFSFNKSVPYWGNDSMTIHLHWQNMANVQCFTASPKPESRTFREKMFFPEIRLPCGTRPPSPAKRKAHEKPCGRGRCPCRFFESLLGRGWGQGLLWTLWLYGMSPDNST